MKKLTAATFDENVYDSGMPCLVMFSRKTCHVCQSVHPLLEELSEDEDYQGKFNFYEVDIEEDPSLFTGLGLKGVPQTIFFNENREYVAKIAGEEPLDNFAEEIEKLID